MALINDLLDISRIESGRITLNLEPIDLAAIIGSVVATMRPLLESKNNGMGVPAEDVPRLFTRFFCVDSSLTRQIGGTGLGLSIVKSIVELQSGSVSVETELDHGSTFAFTLPLASAAATEAAPLSQVVLVVERDAEVGQQLESSLLHAGYTVQRVPTTAAALARLDQAQPDLVMVRIRLTAPCGFDETRPLAVAAEARGIPLLVVSIQHDPTDTSADAAAAPRINEFEVVRHVQQALAASSSRRVLIIEDDAATRRLLSVGLSSACTSRTAFRWTPSSATATSPRSPSLASHSPTPLASGAFVICWMPTKPTCSTTFARWVHWCATGSPRSPSTSGWPLAGRRWACTVGGPMRPRPPRSACATGSGRATSGWWRPPSSASSRLAADMRNARVAEVEQVSGAHQTFFVVRMPGGRRKQLLYDLTARIVDAPALGVNLAIVSTWARTGWNVLRPNVLIDATATRDVTAWQQLRGRAMRALRTWTNDCYRLIVMLAAEPAAQDAADVAAGVLREIDGLPADLEPLRARALHDGLQSLNADERQALRVGVILARNKVTHIYELVKAFGATRQVEYDRGLRTWRRREAIERKHAYEHAVDVRSGEVVQGVGHAPLVYRSDRGPICPPTCTGV